MRVFGADLARVVRLREALVDFARVVVFLRAGAFLVELDFRVVDDFLVVAIGIIAPVVTIRCSQYSAVDVKNANALMLR